MQARKKNIESNEHERHLKLVAPPPNLAYSAHVRSRLSPLATPRKIEFCADLPKTRSGKIQRNQLRRRENFDKEKVFMIE